MTRRRLAVAGGAVVIAVLVALALRPTGPGEVVSGRAPAFTTFDLAGRPVRSADFAGRPLLVNFWASWCVPCRREFPLLKKAHDTDGVTILGVVFQDSRRAAARFMADEHATWPGLVDPKGQIAEAYGVRLRPGLPVTIAVNAQGRIVERHVGELRADDLARLIATSRT